MKSLMLAIFEVLIVLLSSIYVQNKNRNHKY